MKHRDFDAQLNVIKDDLAKLKTRINDQAQRTESKADEQNLETSSSSTAKVAQPEVAARSIVASANTPKTAFTDSPSGSSVMNAPSAIKDNLATGSNSGKWSLPIGDPTYDTIRQLDEDYATQYNEFENAKDQKNSNKLAIKVIRAFLLWPFY